MHHVLHQMQGMLKQPHRNTTQVKASPSPLNTVMLSDAAHSFRCSTLFQMQHTLSDAAFQMQHTLSDAAHPFRCSTLFQMQHTLSDAAHPFRCSLSDAAHSFRCSTPFQMQHTLSDAAHSFRCSTPFLRPQAIGSRCGLVIHFVDGHYELCYPERLGQLSMLPSLTASLKASLKLTLHLPGSG